ncbi:MAG: flippase-like domain-containing protein [Clostridia bacterium]|nr:flippase-like domain-containing protein [Clostridia bacterium]
MAENNKKSIKTSVKKTRINIIKTKKLIAPLLKNLRYKKGKLHRYKINYAENLSDTLRYSIFPTIKKHKKIDIEKEQELQAEKEVAIEEKKIKSKKRKKWLNFIYFALNLFVIAIVLVIQLSGEQNPFESLTAIFDINWWFILAAVGTVFVGIFCDQIRFTSLLHGTTGVFRSNLGFKLGIVGKYYDVITPLSTGGQPFQVLYANKYGIKAGAGISVTMAKYIFAQIVYFIFATYFMFSNFVTTNVNPTETVATGLATTLSWVGYGVMAAVILTVTFVSLNRRAGAGIVVGSLKLLSKIKIGKFKIIKDYNKSFKNVINTVNIWHKTTKKYSKSFGIIIINIFVSIIYFLSTYSMPFFIYCAFAGWHPEMWMKIISIAIMVDLSSAFNPIPMGTGTADLSFTAFFAVLFVNSGLGAGPQVWALIIWRFLFYYIHILNGFLVLTYDYFIGNKRLEKNKEIWLHNHKERKRIKMEQKMNK